MLLVDSHCHLQSLDYSTPAFASVDDIMQQAKAKHIQKFLSLSVTLDDFETMANLLNNYADIYLACGIHPSDINHAETFDEKRMLKLCQQYQPICIGEIGLDYHYNPIETRTMQRNYLAQQIVLANQLRLPVAVHTREAREDTLAILASEQATGIIHCFTENQAFADRALELGMYISISGIVTFKNADELRKVVMNIPLDRLLIETDSPYLAPVPFRGKQNQPAYLYETCKFIAGLRKIDTEELATITTNNFQRLFKLNFAS